MAFLFFFHFIFIGRSHGNSRAIQSDILFFGVSFNSIES
jgi:hypothetical protein